MKNVFKKEVSTELVERIHGLAPETQPQCQAARHG